MRMPGPRWWCALAAAALALPAAAEQTVVAFGGWRSGSGFEAADGTPLELRSAGAASLAWEWPFDAGRRVQAFVSRQSTHLRLGPAAASAQAPQELPLEVSYLHLGGTNYVDGRRGEGAYVSGGLGLTHMSPRLAGLSARWRWSLGLGLGYEWPLATARAAAPGAGGTSGLSLRAELRGYATLVRSAGSFFCDGGCTVQIRGDALVQLEAMVGLAYSF
jgi:hypothetical protein